MSKIAWIGTGVMGAPMAGHLLAAGHELVVHTRTRAKAESLLDRGARWADSPGEASEGADVTISMVGFPADVEATHLGAGGTLSAAAPPALVIDMTTSRPALAAHLADVCRRRGIGCVDAPVSGGDVGAREATLSIMVGAASADFERVEPLLRTLGRTVILHGGPGAGQHAKMINQILIASTMMGVCEGMLYADRAGLDAELVIRSVGSGAAGSWTINNLGPRVARGDFGPGFYVEHFIKDLGIALEEAARLDVAVPGLALAHQLYRALRAQGHGRLGTHALMLAYERLCGDENRRSSDESLPASACPGPKQC